MAITNTSTSARTGLRIHGSPALRTPITAAPEGGPLERADAAEEDGEKALYQKAYAEVGEHRENRHHQPAGEAGEAGADGEGERVDAVGRDAGGARERGVLEGGPDREADAGARQKDPESDQHDRRDEDDHAAPAGELERAQAERADEGIGHRVVEATDEPPHALADDEADGIGTEHGDNRLSVEEPDHATLEREADERHHERRGHHAGPHGITVAVREVDGIRTQQQELSVGEIEDPHHARDHAEAGDHQHHDGAEAREVEADADDVLHGCSLDFRTGSQSPGP